MHLKAEPGHASLEMKSSNQPPYPWLCELGVSELGVELLVSSVLVLLGRRLKVTITLFEAKMTFHLSAVANFQRRALRNAIPKGQSGLVNMKFE